MERGGSVYFFHADAVGSIRSLTDATGRPVRSWAYDSFGRMSGFDPAAQPASPYAFAGREYDAESGLYYLRARYYDPATGRFTSADPLDVTALLPLGITGLLRDPQRLNLYSYAVNNPLAFRDPTGLKPGVAQMTSNSTSNTNNSGPANSAPAPLSPSGSGQYVMGTDSDFDHHVSTWWPDYFETHNTVTITWLHDQWAQGWRPPESYTSPLSPAESPTPTDLFSTDVFSVPRPQHFCEIIGGCSH
jgi:RHS repeat-associated protein